MNAFVVICLISTGIVFGVALFGALRYLLLRFLGMD